MSTSFDRPHPSSRGRKPQLDRRAETYAGEALTEEEMTYLAGLVALDVERLKAQGSAWSNDSRLSVRQRLLEKLHRKIKRGVDL